MSVTIPKMSLSVQEDEESSLGDINSLAVGLGLHQAWIYSAMFGQFSVFGISVNTNGQVSSPIFLISIITFSLCLLLMGLLDQKLLKFLVEKRVMTASAVLTFIGTLLVLLCGDSGMGLLFSFFAGITTGIGSSILVAFWGTAFARRDIPTIAINTAMAIVIGASVYVILLHVIPTPFSGVLAAFLPLASAAFLWQNTPAAYTTRHELPMFTPLPVHKGVFLFRLGVPMVVFGFVLGYVRGNITGEILPNSDPFTQSIVLMIAGVLVLLGYLVAIVATPDNEPNALCRAMLAPIGLAIICTPFADQGTTWGIIALLAGYMMFEALMWIYLGSISQEYGMSPIAVYGIGRGSLALGSVIGALVGAQFSLLMRTATEGGATALSALILGLLLAYCALPSFRAIARMVKPATTDRTVVDELNESRQTADNTVAPIEGDFTNQDGFKGGRFRKRCEMVANHYLLSRRESEVLFFLAKGHNAAYLQEKLYISEGTAKTHIRHIYKKTGVHNQQELMRVVEHAEEELE